VYAHVHVPLAAQGRRQRQVVAAAGEVEVAAAGEAEVAAAGEAEVAAAGRRSCSGVEHCAHDRRQEAVVQQEAADDELEGAEAALEAEAVATTLAQRPNLRQPRVKAEVVVAASWVDRAEAAVAAEAAEELPVVNPIDSWEAEQRQLERRPQGVVSVLAWGLGCPVGSS
jgi:hypothetical protein